MKKRETTEEILAKFWRDLRYKLVEVAILAVVVVVVLAIFSHVMRGQMADQQAAIKKQIEAAQKKRIDPP